MNNNVCVGTGLVALDIILNDNKKTEPLITAGGSCGNVLTILSFLGWNSYPIARLDESEATQLILEDLAKNNVNTSLISKKEDGSAPIIIHRILTDRNGNPKHRFEFRSPKTGKWFPNFKPVLNKSVNDLEPRLPSADFYYFDRLNRSSIELAKINKKNGATIFFEPSSIGNEKMFAEALAISDIIKVSNERISDYKDKFQKTNITLEIITLGEEGLDYRFKNGKWIHSEPINIDGLIDSAGAGDWCSAGIIEKLSGMEKSIDKLNYDEISCCLNYGQKLGAINCLYVGARGLMDYIDEKELDKLTDILGKESELFIDYTKSVIAKEKSNTNQEFLKELV
ncbi:PfkB family carbohydrate kinase [Christiangramia sp. OXR-203]|uniref:PfkB family carbohydrate kinase n=1 Tax=Christiangramia sp. OXR-203 TaxID=3100176 RepID=UPI002AC8A065|nr:PfkB family carbohydrate kinase [Christiangramia sp. OXR-203]WPY97310.1 PfkB family carbohydrate kinase [Christiangramia sp. OXR-203]